MDNPAKEAAAQYDFEHAHNRAITQELLAPLTKMPVDLLSYEEVYDKLHLRGGTYRGLQDIPIDMIVGSVGRYRDFTRTFLPRSAVNAQRWARVRALAESEGWPPIEAYKIDDVYFVKDGNHRVSAAREMGYVSIEGYVTEIASPVPLDASMTPMDLIIKADYAEFLACTHLDKLRPDQNIEFTAPGRYRDLLTHIVAHQYCLEQGRGEPVAWEEAATGWYDHVYLPLVRLIKEKELLKEFPHRTEADLYAWVTRYELELRRLHDVREVDDGFVVKDFAHQYSERPILGQLKAVQRTILRLFGRKQPPPEAVSTPRRSGCADDAINAPLHNSGEEPH
jgi:hypothetical protein